MIYYILAAILTGWVLQKQMLRCVYVCVYVYINLCLSLSLSLNLSVYVYFKELVHTVVELTGPKSIGKAGHLSRSQYCSLEAKFLLSWETCVWKLIGRDPPHFLG